MIRDESISSNSILFENCFCFQFSFILPRGYCTKQTRLNEAFLNLAILGRGIRKSPSSKHPQPAVKRNSKTKTENKNNFRADFLMQKKQSCARRNAAVSNPLIRQFGIRTRMAESGSEFVDSCSFRTGIRTELGFGFKIIGMGAPDEVSKDSFEVE